MAGSAIYVGSKNFRQTPKLFPRPLHSKQNCLNPTFQANGASKPVLRAAATKRTWQGWHSWSACWHLWLGRGFKGAWSMAVLGYDCGQQFWDMFCVSIANYLVCRRHLTEYFTKLQSRKLATVSGLVLRRRKLCRSPVCWTVWVFPVHVACVNVVNNTRNFHFLSFFPAIAVGNNSREIMMDWEWVQQNLMETLGELVYSLLRNFPWNKIECLCENNSLYSSFQLHLKNQRRLLSLFDAKSKVLLPTLWWKCQRKVCRTKHDK